MHFKQTKYFNVFIHQSQQQCISFSGRLYSSNSIKKREILSLVHRSASLDCFRKSATLRTSAPYDIINLLYWIFIVSSHNSGGFVFCWWLFLTTCYQLFFFVFEIFFSHFIFSVNAFISKINEVNPRQVEMNDEDHDE